MIERAPADKLSHKSVNYEHPSKHSPDECEDCAHFIKASPPRCESVQNPIRDGDWCKRFSRIQEPR
jgi:hypothetical protein